MRVNHPITRGPVVPTGSKLRNRFCFNPAERERRRFDSRRAAETVLEDAHHGEHMHEALPAVNGFSCHTRDKKLNEPSFHEPDSDEELLDDMATDAIATHFWNNLEDTPLDDRRIPVDCAQDQCIMNDLTLFSLVS